MDLGEEQRVIEVEPEPLVVPEPEPSEPAEAEPAPAGEVQERGNVRDGAGFQHRSRFGRFNLHFWLHG